MKKSQFQFEARKTLLLLLAWWIFRTSLTDWNTVQTTMSFKLNLLFFIFHFRCQYSRKFKIVHSILIFLGFPSCMCRKFKTRTIAMGDCTFFTNWLLSLIFRKIDTASLYLHFFLNTGKSPTALCTGEGGSAGQKIDSLPFTAHT